MKDNIRWICQVVSICAIILLSVVNISPLLDAAASMAAILWAAAAIAFMVVCVAVFAHTLLKDKKEETDLED